MSVESQGGEPIQAPKQRYYRVYMKEIGSERWVPLERITHLGLYDTEKVNKSVQVLRENWFLAGVTFADGTRMYNLITFEAEVQAMKNDLNAFILHPAEII